MPRRRLLLARLRGSSCGLSCLEVMPGVALGGTRRVKPEHSEGAAGDAGLTRRSANLETSGRQPAV